MRLEAHAKDMLANVLTPLSADAFAVTDADALPAACCGKEPLSSALPLLLKAMPLPETLASDVEKRLHLQIFKTADDVSFCARRRSWQHVRASQPTWSRRGL